MPLDAGAHYQEISREEYERKTRTWTLEFCWFPKICISTNRRMWLEYAYCGRKTQRYDNDFVESCSWMDKNEFLIERIMGKV